MQRILVIKHGALGDFVLATGPFFAIRHAHPDDQIVLLTTAAFAALGQDSGCFDEIWVDKRPSWHNLIGIQKLRANLRRGRFSRVYDLQTSARSSWYFRMMRGYNRPQWSGIARGCSHPHTNTERNRLHTVERQADQLAMIGLNNIPGPNLSWLDANIDHFNLPDRFVLLVPGGAPHRPQKRWPAAQYIQLSRIISESGLYPVVVGGDAEVDLGREIVEHSDAISITGKTSFADLAALSRRAAAAVGNDTGPMHITAICGCPSVVLFSQDSDPAITAPRGPDVTVLRFPKLVELPVYKVAAALSLR
ncbi:MAG: glycosyltransferase family 9 protein [Pseudomonadota bacterium]|nr:glycosyltransferase family 9 protein [Pseudomonadota bacterium]